MANIKFSEFQDAGPLDPSDEVVGLQGGVNTRFPQSLFKGDPGEDGLNGSDGGDGADGTSATADAGTTTTLVPGSNATVINAGTPTDAVFNFGIPRGDPGIDGTNGIDGGDGLDGNDGLAATIAVGTTTTLAPGSDATVTNVGTPGVAVFDFGIPEGEQGQSGSGTGDVNGPATSSAGNVAVWDNGTGDLLADSAKVAADLVTNAGISTSGNLPILSGTSGKVIVDSGKSAASVVTGPASAAADNIATYSTTTGKVIKDGGVAISELATAAQGALAASAVQSTVGGTGITVDATDPQNPIINADGGAAGGQVDSVVAGSGVTVNSADPVNPVVSSPLAASALQSGDNVSELVNDAGYGTGNGDGDVVGPATSQDNHLAVWNGTSGELLQDSTKDADDVVVNTGTAVSANFAAFNGGSGKVIQDAGVSSSSFVANSWLSTITSATQPGDNLSTLTNDEGFKRVDNGTVLPATAGYAQGDVFLVYTP